MVKDPWLWIIAISWGIICLAPIIALRIEWLKDRARSRKKPTQ